jgi:hypothetical protein
MRAVFTIVGVCIVVLIVAGIVTRDQSGSGD